MEAILHQLIRLKPSANGLAIIIGNENSCKPEHVHLTGTIKDLEAARDAFESLKFTTLPIRNASAQEIVDVVLAASRYDYPSCYTRIAFVFSGHGDETCIYAHDSPVNLRQYIFGPLMPVKSNRLADIPKLFFFDACRGDAVDQGVFITLRQGGPIAKGGRAPSVGNYLLANATMHTMKAFEKPNSGGYWMQHLAKELQNDANIEKSFADILTIVNDKVLTDMESPIFPNIQQPVHESTLRKSIYPIKDARNAGPEVFLNFPPYTDPQEILSGYGCIGLHMVSPVVDLLNKYDDASQTGLIASEETYSQSIQQHTPMIWNQAPVPQPIVAHGNSQHPIQAATGANSQPQLFPLSSGASSENVGICIDPPQPIIANVFHEGLSPMNQSSVDVNSMQDFTDYQGVLNQLSQHNKIKIISYFDEPANSRMLYRSHVSLRHIQTGQTITGSSAHVRSKHEAREQAAQDAWCQVQTMEERMVARPFQVQEGRGSSKPSAATPASDASLNTTIKPTSKVWRSKLEEYYDKKAIIKYVSKESPKGGFVSTVFCPVIGYAEGEGPSKQAAENNAAYNAIKKLEI